MRIYRWKQGRREKRERAAADRLDDDGRRKKLRVAPSLRSAALGSMRTRSRGGLAGCGLVPNMLLISSVSLYYYYYYYYDCFFPALLRSLSLILFYSNASSSPDGVCTCFKHHIIYRSTFYTSYYSRNPTFFARRSDLPLESPINAQSGHQHQARRAQSH